jgi:hypothetical protein
MKKRFQLLLALWAATLAVSAQTRILGEALYSTTGTNNQSITSENKPEGLEDWTFSNCKTILDNGYYWIEVEENGYIMTPPLTGLSGNARISIYLQAVDTESTITYGTNDERVLSRYSNTIESSDGWLRMKPILLRNGNSDTRFKISGSNFRVCNVQILDIGDGVFYESFNRCDGTGGRDGSYTIPSASVSSSNLDYTIEIKDANIKFATKAKNCLAFKDNGYINVFGFPTSSTSDYVLSFNVAGTRDDRKIITIGSQTCEIENLSTWEHKQLYLQNVNASTGFRIQANLCFLDDILISEIKQIPIDEAIDNTATISERDGKIVYAQLTRTFITDTWNTCCLPFDITVSKIQEAAGTPTPDIELRTLESITDDGVFTFSEAPATITAGTPFLLKTSRTLTNLTFPRVTISQTTPGTIAYGGAPGYSFKGTYSPVDLNTDGTHVFLGTDGKFHTPATAANSLKGMRAYFVVPEKTSARIFFNDNEQTSIVTANANSKSSTIYNLQGTAIKKPLKGIYIENGKKIIK